MALKVKGAPKAGPKKRRAKQEAEADRIRRAVEEHGTRVARGSRRASKVREYTYKKPAERKQPILSPSPSVVGMNDRNEREWHEWEEAIILSEPGKVLSELETFQMLCDHKALREEKALATLTEEREYRRCPHCQAILRWWGSYTMTIQGEWMTYRVEGYDMATWGELFDKDKTLWPFVLEEAQAALTEEAEDE